MDESNLHHEPSDADVWAIARFGIVLGLGLIVFAGLTWFVFQGFAKREERKSPRLTPVELERPKLPPEPRLQAAPALDLKEMRAGEDAVLNGYGWIDPDKGIARIPIDKAIEIMAQNLKRKPQ